jgi:uncharacterized iron-regulated membrane protein
LGLAVQARRAGEEALPLSKRLLISIGPILLTATLSAGGAVFGTMQAFSAEIRALHEEDIRIKGQIQERTAVREQQMSEFRSACADAHARIALLESRQRDAEILAAELRAFMRHEQAEFPRSKR